MDEEINSREVSVNNRSAPLKSEGQSDDNYGVEPLSTQAAKGRCISAV